MPALTQTCSRPKGNSLLQTMDQYPLSPLVPVFLLPTEMGLLLAPQMALPLRPSREVGLRRPTSS